MGKAEAARRWPDRATRRDTVALGMSAVFAVFCAAAQSEIRARRRRLDLKRDSIQSSGWPYRTAASELTERAN